MVTRGMGTAAAPIMPIMSWQIKQQKDEYLEHVSYLDTQTTGLWNIF